MRGWWNIALLTVALSIGWLRQVHGLSKLNKNDATTAGPPAYDEYAAMARYIIHQTKWVSIATISIQDDIKGYPFVSLKSHSDGPQSNSTGVPYIYMTDMDVSGADLLINSKVTIMASLAETDYCQANNLDPQDPQCAKVILTGTFVKVNNETEEYQFGKNSLFERHPAMETWPESHGFYVSKVQPEQIMVLDYYGGASMVTPDEYFNVTDVAPYSLTNSGERNTLMYLMYFVSLLVLNNIM